MTFLGAAKEVEADDLVIISYPFVSGGNIPSKCSDFVGVVTQLASMHDKSFVHGDIRLSNMVFTPDGRSTLIDFDFTGKQGVNKYPQGFVEDLVDTVRHTEAKGGQLLSIEHDLFSMAAVMHLFTCSNTEWEGACDAVRSGRLLEVASFLSGLTDQIEIQAHLQFRFSGSGSPNQWYSKKRSREEKI
jgi:serine/threonine protein kinase